VHLNAPYSSKSLVATLPAPSNLRRSRPQR
jgi:hypothetical protein